MRKKIYIAILLYSFNLTIRAQFAGDLDSTYSLDGFSTTFNNSSGSYEDLIIQPDGKIIGTGRNDNQQTVTIRNNSNGSLDYTFGVNGIVSMNFGGVWPRFNELQLDGKILVAGLYFDGANGYSSVLRFNQNGTIDSSFDFDGQTTILLNSTENIPGDLKVQNDGKILIAGTAKNGTSSWNMIVIRLNTDGSIDSSFSFDGVAKINAPGYNPTIYTMAIQADGKIVIGGTLEAGTLHKYVLIRFDSNGNIDNTFDADGIVNSNLLNDNIFKSIAIQSDGKIVAAGTIQMSGSKDFLTVRFNTDGSLDNNFGNNGISITDFNLTDDSGNALSIQSDNKIIVVGAMYSPLLPLSYNTIIARYNSNGVLDINFGSSGKVISTTFESTTFANSCALQADGRIVVSGFLYSTLTAKQYYYIARYLNESTNGTEDYDKPNLLNIYPNPVLNDLSLKLPDNITKGVISFFDSQGKMILIQNFFDKKEVNINLPNISSGLYFIRIIDEDGKMYTSKVIKK